MQPRPPDLRGIEAQRYREAVRKTVARMSVAICGGTKKTRISLRSSGLRRCAAPSLRGALATKQSSLRLLALDCFAALAMTRIQSRRAQKNELRIVIRAPLKLLKSLRRRKPRPLR